MPYPLLDNSEWIFRIYKPNISINLWDTTQYYHVRYLTLAHITIFFVILDSFTLIFRLILNGVLNNLHKVCISCMVHPPLISPKFRSHHECIYKVIAVFSLIIKIC